MKKIGLIVSLVLLGTYLNVVAFLNATHAGTFTAFGPKDYARSTKKPVKVTDNFSVLNPDTSYTVHVHNGGKSNQFRGKISSAVVKLNGAEVVRPREFNQKVSYIEKPIHLLNDNKLTVEIRSKPDSGITVEIIGVDNDPPTITAILTPPPNAAGWNNTDVTVSFQCSDMTSGIASCSDPVLVQTEGAGQVITGYTTDMAGNAATTSVTVKLDKTPPSVAITKPADGAILQDSPVNVKGNVGDTLSGIAAVACNGNDISPSNSTFSTDVPLVEGENLIIVEATDMAGNTGDASITVIYDPPELELTYVDQFELVWWDKKSGGSFNGAYWRPIVPDGFYALGHYGEGDYSDPPRGFMFAARELTPGALARPVNYVKVWDDRGSDAKLNGSFWRPVPPEGYVCLGLVGQREWSKPSTDEIMCVRQDLVVQGKVGNTIWIDEQTHADVDFGSWQIIPADKNGIFIGTFTGNNSHSTPPIDGLFCIDARSVKRYEPDSAAIEQFVQRYGPHLYFYDSGNNYDKWEDYFLDDPEYVLDRAALVWGLVEDEWDYDSFSFNTLGSFNTSAAGLMQDVESNVKSSPYFSDPSFRYYLRIDDSLKLGNLDRAKALVRVRPWNWLFTELQFWFFYPFNGPARAEVCASGKLCVIMHFNEAGRHYGDWEQVTLRIDNRTKELFAVYMSRHGGGQWVLRNNFVDVIEFNGTNPGIYVAKYSHAHYPNAGAHDYERVYEWDYDLGTASVDLRDLTNGHGEVFSTNLPGKYRIISSALPGYQVTEPEWLQFRGRWGQYEQLLLDIFFIFDLYTWKEVGAGPTGPAMKGSWARENWWWTRNLEGNEACFDGIDNDGDGEIDCHDPDCWQFHFDPVCVHNGWWWCHVMDSDQDGKVDCHDRD